MATEWRGWRLVLVCFLLLAVFAFKGVLIQPPPVPAKISQSEFDTARAFDRLQRILGDQKPHPVDSIEDDAVRSRLITEISAIGLKPEVHEAMDCSGFPKSRVVSCSRVRNVIAVIPGGNAPALLLNAHYDSTPTGPGAADDGIGVATLLEVGAHLRGEKMARPVILLFNEGEEYGLNGAAAFAESDPLAKSVGKLINIEARGVNGPAFMFETSEPNASPIGAFKAATSRPFANSISTDFAKLIPNSTDVVKFKPKGWKFLSYAIIGNETRYHSPGDNLDALSKASLYHMGSEVLAASRRLAGPDTAKSNGRSLFMDIGGWTLVTLPVTAGAILLGLLAFATVVLVVRRRAWRPVVTFAIAVVASTAVAAIAATCAGFLRAGDYWRAYPWVTTLAIAATVIAVEAWFAARIGAHHDRSKRRLAAWTVVLFFGVLASFALPGAIIFFVLGPLLAVVGLVIRSRAQTLGRNLALAGAVVQLIILTELIAQIELTLIDGPIAAIAPLVGLASLPLLAETGRGSSRRDFIVMGLVALALWVGALLMPRSSAERPLAFTLDHVQDERTGKAVWAAATKQAPMPDAFSRFGQSKVGPLPYNKRVRWQTTAPKVDGPRGTVSVIASAADPQGRLVRVQLDRGDADALLLRFDEKTPVIGIGLPGHVRMIDKDADKGPSFIRCSGRGCDRLKVDLLFGNAKPVTAMLVVQRFKAPNEAASLLGLRPKTAQPQYSPDSQVSIQAVKL